MCRVSLLCSSTPTSLCVISICKIDSKKCDSCCETFSFEYKFLVVQNTIVTLKHINIILSCILPAISTANLPALTALYVRTSYLSTIIDIRGEASLLGVSFSVFVFRLFIPLKANLSCRSVMNSQYRSRI